MDTPDAPDPAATAAAQTKSNKETADYQAALNATSQVGPTGSSIYTQNGTWSNGAPKWTQTTTLTPEQQAIFNKNQGTQGILANIGNEQAGKVQGILNNPFDLSAEADNKYNDLARARLDPQWQQNAQSNEAQLFNRGITPGSDAYNRAMSQFNNSKNDAYNSMYLNGKQLFDTEATAERNQPLNEISALMSGSQVSSPTFGSTPQTQVANTDVAGIYQNAYNSQQQQSNAAMGGLFGLGGTLASGLFSMSDRRLKQNIVPIGKYPCGATKYEFNYTWSKAKKVGAIAQEVEEIMPEAVFDACGWKAVNYRMLEAA